MLSLVAKGAVHSLVGELRSHMLCSTGQKTKILKKRKRKNTIAPLITRVISVCSRFHMFCNTNMACTSSSLKLKALKELTTHLMVNQQFLWVELLTKFTRQHGLVNCT